MPTHILVDRIGKVGKITFNRPATLNAFTPEMLGEVTAAVQDFERDPAVRALLICGAGDSFSAGGDMDFLDELGRMTPFEIKGLVYANFAGATKTVKLCSMPTVAAVNGPAVGAGCEMAVACDFRIASDRAMFTEAWIKLACIPPLGGMFLLPQIVGLAKATEMIMLGTQVGAEEAKAIGLANKVVPAEALEEEGLALAARLADGPPKALAVIKEGLRRGMESTLAAEWDFNVYAQSMLIADGDFSEAVSAFKEKRKPAFSAD